MEASIPRHPEIEGARMQAMIARLASRTSDEMADAVADFVIKSCTVRRQQLITEYELMVESGRRPALQESTAGWPRSLRAQMVEVMTALGSVDPEIDARLLLAVISGPEVDSLADEPGSAQRTVARATILRLVAATGAIVDRQEADPRPTEPSIPRLKDLVRLPTPDLPVVRHRIK